MGLSRRELIEGAALAAGVLALGGRKAVAGPDEPPGRVLAGAPRVVTPNGATLAHRVVDGVKVFHLVAEEVDHEFTEGLRGRCWGYNGRVHGPTLEAVEGDTVRIYVTNRLPDPTTVHWHGLHVPNGMDGVSGLSQRAIEPGETFRYEFTLRQHGTFMYHSHHDEMAQQALGLMGMFIVHPRSPTRTPVDRDFAYMLSEWAIEPGMRRPDVNEMTDFNVITFNGKVFPDTAPLVVRTGERVRIRLGNLSAMNHHPIHLHGHSFLVVETDGGEIPEAGRWPETTVLVPVGSTRTIEFTAHNPGDWAFHCHMTHHTMTQMGHGIPNLYGIGPSPFDERLMELVPEYHAVAQGEAQGYGHGHSDGHAMGTIPENSAPMMGGHGAFGYIPMGGMFTILKVRDELKGEGDPGWYENPEGTVAEPATPEQLKADGI